MLTLPCSVPIIRHPPPTERFLRVTSPTKLIHTDRRADRRNADQILLQTSGEVGKFYVDPESTGVKLGKKPLETVHRTIGRQFNLGLSYPEPAVSRNIQQNSGRDIVSSGANTNFVQSSGRDHGFESSREKVLPSSRRDSSQYLATLQRLDKSFTNSDRRDLFAASMPSRSAQELVWCASTNNKGAQASKVWAEKLRRESTS